MVLQSLPHSRPVRRAASAFVASQDQLIDLCVQIQQIPAPTGYEKERADWLQERFQEIGLDDVWQDHVCNVYGRIAGAQSMPALLVSAHTDTVFPADTDLAIQRNGNTISGPGIGDNSVGVAGLLMLARTLRGLPAPPVDIWLVANSNEEGLGDLKGMRAAVATLQDRTNDRIGAAVVLEGMGLGRIVHQALGVRRYRIRATAPGGHSWGDFGAASAIHALVNLSTELTRMKVPSEPRTSFNIGVFRGGTSVNTIAQDASLELDLRSTDPQMLTRIDTYVCEMVERHQRNHDRYRSGVHFRIESIGDRPGGEIASDHPMVQALSTILHSIGIDERPDVRISSTDANVPLSQGIPAVCIGLTEGGDAHRLSEWIDCAPLLKGMQQLLYFVWWTAAWLTRQE